LQSRLSRKGFHSILAVVLLFLAVLAGSASGATFTASLDRDTISLGESATLSLSFEGAQPKNVPTPSVSGLQILQAGTSQNVSFVNGAMSSSVTVNFSVTPTRTGEFQIPAITVDVNGQPLSSQPLKLIVTQPNAPSAANINSGNEVAFMRLTLPQEKIYEGETIVGELQIFLRDDVQNFGNFQITSKPTDGFVIGKTAQAGRAHTQIGNRVYTVIPISVALTATRAGDLSIGPFTANLTVVLPSQNQGGDPFFAQFFNQGEQKQVSLATDEIKAQALPLPNENVPTNFNGAIGDFSMNVNAGPTNVTVGDPITVRVQISGRGSLDSLKLPDQSGWNNFKIFTPTQKTDFSDQLDLQGTKTFEEIVTPENTDVHALPEFSFSFFNPNDGQYHTLTQPPTPLMVRAGGATPLPTIAANQNSTQQNQTPQDILPIKNDMGTLAQISPPLVTNPVFLGAQSLPVLAFLGALIWRKRADNLANNPRLRRQRAVAQLIQTGIGDLKKFAAENNSEQFFATLFRLLQEQLGERLDCPATSITENVIEENSILRGAPENLRTDLRELFQLCNQARYAPVHGTAELNSVAGKFEKVIQELQGVKA
jgi:hypothetical protein